MYKFLYILCWLPFKILYPVKVIGKENLIKGKAILCCNHHTKADFIPIFYATKTKVYALCKKEILNTKFKKWFLTKLHAIGINRDKPEISSIKKCLDVLNNNYNLLVFPQGTRSTIEEIESLKQGVAMFALKSKAPIIPMVYEKKLKAFRRNKLIIGEPIYFNLDYNKENIATVINKLQTKMNELKGNIENDSSSSR